MSYTVTSKESFTFGATPEEAEAFGEIEDGFVVEFPATADEEAMRRTNVFLGLALIRGFVLGAHPTGSGGIAYWKAEKIKDGE